MAPQIEKFYQDKIHTASKDLAWKHISSNISCRFHVKMMIFWGWRDGSSVKSTFCSCRGLRCSS